MRFDFSNHESGAFRPSNDCISFGPIPLKKAAVIPMYWHPRRWSKAAVSAVMRV